eukprot:403343978
MGQLQSKPTTTSSLGIMTASDGLISQSDLHQIIKQNDDISVFAPFNGLASLQTSVVTSGLQSGGSFSQGAHLYSQEPSSSNLISSRGLILQSMMYGLNVYSELRQLINQYHSNEYAVFYFSKAPSNIGLFIEFFFEILNERCEPIVLVIEGLKSVLRMREYYQLLFRENINVYIDIEAYKDLKRLKEIKENHFTLIRSKRQLPKIQNFQPSSKLEQIRQKQLKQNQIVLKLDNEEDGNNNHITTSLRSSTQSHSHSRTHSSENAENLNAFNQLKSQDMKNAYADSEEGDLEMGIRDQNKQLKPKQKQNVFSQMISWLKRLLSTIYNKLGRYHLDDVLFILRPFIYVYSVYQYGRKSYTPIKICAIIDALAIMVSLHRLSKSQPPSQSQNGSQKIERKDKLRSIEKQQLLKRIRETLIKYLIRDPIFENYTKVVLERLFSALRISPKILQLLLSLIGYFRYYTYIA